MAKILFIDDEAGIIEEVMGFFKEEGYDVQAADSGKEGIEILKSFQPDILVLDIKLPDMSGIEVLKLCKHASPKTKVIVNTGYVDQAIIDEAEELGRDAFLQKPFTLMKLQDEIDRLLG